MLCKRTNRFRGVRTDCDAVIVTCLLFVVQDKINNVQQQIFKNNEKLEEYKSLIKWNQEELDQWSEAQQQKEDDNKQFVKFTKQDQVKVKELEVSIEKLTQKVSDTKRELEDELTETQAAQTQLDKAAEDFRCAGLPPSLNGPASQLYALTLQLHADCGLTEYMGRNLRIPFVSEPRFWRLPVCS